MTKKDKESAEENNDLEDTLEEKENKKLSFEAKYNKKERLRVIKQGILNYLSRVGQSQRGLIADKLTDLKIWENPYEVYTGGKSKQVLVQPIPEEITYCLNYLKDKTLLTYDEKRKIWIMTSELEKKRKGPTLDDFLIN
jgi:hypothetical protein